MKMLDPWKARGLKVLDTANPRGLTMYPKTDTKRHTKAGNGRVLALSSAAWRKLRRYVLACEPLCRHCTARGLTVPATDVDHIANDPSLNDYHFDPVTRIGSGSLQPLCHECHSRKTAKDMGGNVKMGCDLDGRPLDPTHHWNAAAEKSPEADSQTPTCSTDAHGRTSQDG